MANTRQSGKRAGQALKRQAQNTANRSATKTALKAAVDTLKGDGKNAKEVYMAAVKALSKAASKGAIPKGRASRKISRLTMMAKKLKPEVVKSK